VEHKKTDLIFPTFPLLALTIFAQFDKARFYTHTLYFRQHLRKTEVARSWQMVCVRVRVWQ
jgi:hypothetical protein